MRPLCLGPASQILLTANPIRSFNTVLLVRAAMDSQRNPWFHFLFRDSLAEQKLLGLRRADLACYYIDFTSLGACAPASYVKPVV